MGSRSVAACMLVRVRDRKGCERACTTSAPSAGLVSVAIMTNAVVDAASASTAAGLEIGAVAAVVSRLPDREGVTSNFGTSDTFSSGVGFCCTVAISWLPSSLCGVSFTCVSFIYVYNGPGLRIYYVKR